MVYLGGYKRTPAHAANYTTVSKRATDLPLEVDWRRDPRELSLMLKTKADVDPAGLTLQQKL